LYCDVPDIHWPEDANQQEAPVLDRSNQKAVPGGMRGCPQCNAIMLLDERKDVWGRAEAVVLDTCAESGVWLDHSELAILLDRSNQQARRDARRLRGRAIQVAREETRYNNS
jgi:Zn-finger nucleic acid-binding protein